MGLTSIIRGIERPQPPRILLYGTEGIGKSTFAANAPAPIFVSTEDGLGNIDCDKFPLAKTFAEYCANVAAILNEKHEYKTLVVDTLDWLEKLIHSSICEKYKVDSMDKVLGGYGKGYVIAQNTWMEVISQLSLLRAKRGMIILLLAHAGYKKKTDPESGEICQYGPKLMESAGRDSATSLFIEWCDATLFATRRLGAARGENGGGERVMRCVGGIAHRAKNRYGLPDVLPFEWNALQSAIAGYYQAKKGE